MLLQYYLAHVFTRRSLRACSRGLRQRAASPEGPRGTRRAAGTRRSRATGAACVGSARSPPLALPSHASDVRPTHPAPPPPSTLRVLNSVRSDRFITVCVCSCARIRQVKEGIEEEKALNVSAACE